MPIMEYIGALSLIVVLGYLLLKFLEKNDDFKHGNQEKIRFLNEHSKSFSSRNLHPGDWDKEGVIVKNQYLLQTNMIKYVGYFIFFCMNFKLQFIHIILSLYQRISYGQARRTQKKAKTR